MRIGLKIFLGVVWALALWGYFHVLAWHFEKPTNTATATAVVGYSAALLALLGWMIQAGLSIRNSRKQHTMNLLLQSRLSTEFNKHVNAIRSAFPDGSEITYENARKSDAFESIRYILNYYEFISVGLKHRDLDERLLRDSHCTQVCTFCKRLDKFLAHVREENERGIATPKNSRLYNNLRDLQHRWQKHMDQPERDWLGFTK